MSLTLLFAPPQPEVIVNLQNTTKAVLDRNVIHLYVSKEYCSDLLNIFPPLNTLLWESVISLEHFLDYVMEESQTFRIQITKSYVGLWQI